MPCNNNNNKIEIDAGMVTLRQPLSIGPCNVAADESRHESLPNKTTSQAAKNLQDRRAASSWSPFRLPSMAEVAPSALREKLAGLRRELEEESARGPASRSARGPESTTAAPAPAGDARAEVPWRAHGDASIDSRRRVELSDPPRRGQVGTATRRGDEPSRPHGRERAVAGRDEPPRLASTRREREDGRMTVDSRHAAGSKRTREEASEPPKADSDATPAADEAAPTSEPLGPRKRPAVLLDGATEQRSRRMLGALIGHLAKAKARIESVPDQARLTRQQEQQAAALARNAELRAAEREAAEAAARAAKEEHAARLEVLAAEERKTRAALALAVAEQHAADADAAAASGRFLVTAAQPPLFWRPAEASRHSADAAAVCAAAREAAASSRRERHARLLKEAEAAADAEVLEARLRREARRAVTEARAAGLPRRRSDKRDAADADARPPIRTARAAASGGPAEEGRSAGGADGGQDDGALVEEAAATAAEGGLASTEDVKEGAGDHEEAFDGEHEQLPGGGDAAGGVLNDHDDAEVPVDYS